MQPVITASGPATSKDWPHDEALIDLLRARLEGSGIVKESDLQHLFECTPIQIRTALMALENEGYAMRGNFTGSPDTEWCERGLLARIHRYTIKSLRNEIAAVTAADYMRFLFAWHGMTERPEGEDSLLAALDKLEGYAIPAAAWETDVLPGRIKGYQTNALDTLCVTGRIVWTRFASARSKPKEDSTRSSKAGLLRNTPILLLDRHNVDYWRPHTGQTAHEVKLSANATTVLSALKQYGALFFIDIVKQSGLLRTHAEEALAELAACGLVTSDSYAGLRALIAPANKKPGYSRHRRRAIAAPRSIDDAGRWSIITRETGEMGTDPSSGSVPISLGWIQTDMDTLNHIAWTLLKRYGVVFHKMLERESGLPPWRELLYAWRRMEARGEIRGGRFVEGFSGEQFALPDAVALLRKYRDGKQELPAIVISATDPLNLVGIILPGERIPALHTNRILFKNGLPAAKQLNGEIEYFGFMSPQAQWEINFLLTRKNNPAGFVQGTSPYSN
jgi:ATP-dependent Lhr-like helicase